jgi:hypothetical protein
MLFLFSWFFLMVFFLSAGVSTSGLVAMDLFVGVLLYVPVTYFSHENCRKWKTFCMGSNILQEKAKNIKVW